MHTRPVLEWKHGVAEARTGIFNAGNAAVIAVGAAGSPVTGSQFPGNCSTGGVWYAGADFPPEYRNTSHAELSTKWIKNFVMDVSDRPTAVRNFVPESSAAVVAVATHPTEGGLYFIDYGSTLHRISYVGGGNKPPVAKAFADTAYGASPLTVHFTGSSSSDPEMGPLTYDWNFGDGSAHALVADPSHVFTGATPQSFTVTLTVSDVSSATAAATLLVFINNTLLRSPSPAPPTNSSTGCSFPAW